MKECIIVPTWKRNALLYLCLEAIRASDKDIEIHVFPDRATHEDNELKAVCGAFKAEVHPTNNHFYHGNSPNMMEALKWAHKNQYDLTFVIEDDCIVDKTFLSWARNALSTKPDTFAACGWKYAMDAPEADGPDIQIPWYLSVCSAIPKLSLAKICYHAKAEYYKDQRTYLDEAYPENPRKGGMHFEQDGLILRVAEAEGKRFTWPRKPRAIHIGWYGYHMPTGKVLEGDIESQVAVARLAITDPQLLKSLMAGGTLPKLSTCECGQTKVGTGDKGKLICAHCFHKEHPTWARVSDVYYVAV